MQLEHDLARANIAPFAWIVNQSLTPLHLTDPVLRARRNHEAVHLRELATHGKRTPCSNRGRPTSSLLIPSAREV